MVDPIDSVDVADIIPRLRRLRRLRIQHLRFLALLAQLGSLTACAKALHLSQPAVSNLLKDLETAFGATLVERDARGGRLTPAGARVLTRVTHSLAWLDAALQEAGSADIRPTVRVGLMPIVAYAFMPDVVRGLIERRETLQISLLEATVRQWRPVPQCSGTAWPVACVSCLWPIPC